MINEASLPDLPSTLVEAVKSRRAVLFLGAGASKEARDAKGNPPPNKDELRDLLAARFFKKDMTNRDLAAVAEMAISASSGQNVVFEYIKTIFEPFMPSEAHYIIPMFQWRMIATTNYDVIVERAYDHCTEKAQDLIRFVKDDEPIEERLQAARNPVQLLKLHGCIEHIHDRDIPIVLSAEQYGRFSEHRTRLFSRISDVSQESAIVFVGYKLNDGHIRDLIYRLDAKKRPRWYIVSPDCDGHDVDFWGTKNVGVIKGTFGNFMAALDRQVPDTARRLQFHTDVAEFPLRKFYVTNVMEEQIIRDAIGTDLTFVHQGMSYTAEDPKRFYSGYDTDWGAIFRHLDVRRKVEEDLMLRAVIENDKANGPMMFLAYGPAGSGKTIALKRTAVETATVLDGLVLWLNFGGALRKTVFSELWELCQRPVYLFVDHVAIHVDKVFNLLSAAKKDRIPLIVIAGERESEWNTYCMALDNEFAPILLPVGHLNNVEVDGLLDLLEMHDCLGAMKYMTREQRVAAFMDERKADRQLLVALHELTQGKPFEDIILEEHQRIYPEKARQLYLDVATMHQFTVPMRAGTLSRISGIEFADFEQEFFEPLKNVVRAETDPYTRDVLYKTRHSRVASLVFRQVCGDDEQKAKQLIRIIQGFDVGYTSDRTALEQITRGRAVADNFGAADWPRAVYDAASQAAPNAAFILQQRAIFELNHGDGSLAAAEACAAKAAELDPHNRTIIHTQAEVDRKRANVEESPLLKESLRRRARERLGKMPSDDRFAIGSRCKLLVDEIDELSAKLGDDAKEHDARFFADKLTDAEKALEKAQQLFPDDPEAFQVEARLLGILNMGDPALRALEKAWAARPRGTSTAIRIARIYDSRGQASRAFKILGDALNREPDDKATHYAMAMHLLRESEYDREIVRYHFGKSYSREDRNFDARFSFGEFLFLAGDLQGCVEVFADLDRRAPREYRTVAPKQDDAITSRLERFSGTIDTMKDRFCFIRSGCYPNNIFCHYSSFGGGNWNELAIGQGVNFRVRFNRLGPLAVDVQPGRRGT